MMGTVTAGPLSTWSLVVLIGWIVVALFVWLLLFAHGRQAAA